MDWLDIKEFLKDAFKYILFIVIVLLIVIYVVGLQQIVGDSMNPTFNNGDIVIIDKLTPRFNNIKRGDIISFYYDDSKFLVKRVIGLPGESVKIKDNKIYINDKVINDYVYNTNTEDFTLEYDKIPDNHYFVLGDNRSNSLDSREIGLIKKENIIGKKVIKIWPIK